MAKETVSKTRSKIYLRGLCSWEQKAKELGEIKGDPEIIKTSGSSWMLLLICICGGGTR